MAVRKRRRKKDEVPVWLVVVVVIVGAFAVSFPLFSANYVFQWGFIGSPEGGDRLAGQFRGAPSISAYVCNDSDGGINLGVRGTCTSRGQSNADYCWDNVSLVEFSCAANRCVRNIFNCQNYGFQACENGACVNVTPQLPDLTIIDPPIAGGGCGGGSGGNVTCSITLIETITNIGDAAAGQFFVRFADITDPNNTIIIDTPFVSPGLGSQQSVTVNMTYGDLPPNATFDIEVFVDSTDMVSESNENNNIFVRELST